MRVSMLVNDRDQEMSKLLHTCAGQHCLFLAHNAVQQRCYSFNGTLFVGKS